MGKEQIQDLEDEINEWTLAKRNLIYNILYELNIQSRVWLDAFDDNELPNPLVWKDDVKHLAGLVNEVEYVQAGIDWRVKELDDLNAKQS